MERRKDRIFDKLYKISPIGIEVIDIKEKRLVSANNWMIEHLGYTQEEFTELSANLFEKITHPDCRSNQLQAYQTLIEKPSLLFNEFTTMLKKKDGEYAHALIRLSVLDLDPDCSPRTVLGTAMDISELVLLKAQLDQELRKIEIISYKNSHELRGPVATILGLIQLIDYTGLDGHYSQEIVYCLKETVKKLDQVIHEINNHSY